MRSRVTRGRKGEILARSTGGGLPHALAAVAVALPLRLRRACCRPQLPWSRVVDDCGLIHSARFFLLPTFAPELDRLSFAGTSWSHAGGWHCSWSRVCGEVDGSDGENGGAAALEVEYE